MAIEFTVDHDHTYAGEEGIEQLIGWVTFSVSTYPGDFRVREQGAGTPRVINLPSRRGWLAADGHLYKDQTLELPCRLVGNDPAFNLQHLTYRAEFDLTTALGDPVAVPHCYFPAPGTDTTLFLTKVMTGGPSQTVMEVRTKGYVEDILDAGELGQGIVRAEFDTDARAALGASAVGDALFTTPSAGDARTTIDAASPDDITNAIGSIDIPGQVSAAVAADSTVKSAAAAAVTTNIAGRNLLEALPIPSGYESSYSLVETDQNGVVSRYVTAGGYTWVRLDPTVTVAASNIGADIPVPKTATTDGSVVYAVTDAADVAAFAVGPDGSVTIPKPSAKTLTAFGNRTVDEPSWSTKVRVWEQQRALYNFHPTKLQRWFAALARASAGTGTAHITTFIDSETFGAGDSMPKWSKSWPGRLRRMLDTMTGYASGTGIAVPWNEVTSNPTFDPRWAFGSSAAQVAGPDAWTGTRYGPDGNGAIRLTNNTGNGWLEFAPVGSITNFTIYALADTGATGLATIKVDGVSVGTLDVSAAGGSGTITRRAGTLSNVIVADITGLTSAAHTLRIEGPAASTVVIWGVEGGTGNGVRVSNMARSNQGVYHLVLDDGTNHTAGMSLHFDTIKADLAVLMLGLNDRTNTSATFKASITTAVSRIQAAGGDVLLVCPGQPDYTNGAVGTDSLQPRYADMYQIADTLDLPLLDLGWVRTDYATANTLGLYYDYIHSNNTGLEHHARFIFNTLTGV